MRHIVALASHSIESYEFLRCQVCSFELELWTGARASDRMSSLYFSTHARARPGHTSPRSSFLADSLIHAWSRFRPIASRFGGARTIFTNDLVSLITIRAYFAELEFVCVNISIMHRTARMKLRPMEVVIISGFRRETRSLSGSGHRSDVVDGCDQIR